MLTNDGDQDTELIKAELQPSWRRAANDRQECRNNGREKWDALETECLKNVHDGIDDRRMIDGKGGISDDAHQRIDDDLWIVIFVGRG